MISSSYRPSLCHPSMRFGISKEQQATLDAVAIQQDRQKYRNIHPVALAQLLVTLPREEGHLAFSTKEIADITAVLIEKLNQFPYKGDPKDPGYEWGKPQLEKILDWLDKAYPGEQPIPENLFDAYIRACQRTPS
jgi:hypothetical protein